MLKHLILITAACLASLPTFAEVASDPFVRDLRLVTSWFEGEFDNEEQLWFHTRSGSTADKPTRIHITNMRVDLPEFGEHVFYTEEYADNNPKNIIRQRLVTFETDIEEGAVRMKQGFFKKADAVLGGKNFDRLKPKDVFFLDQCDVLFNRVADQIEGSMKPKQCVFGEGEEQRYSVHNITMSENKFWRVDATFLTSNDEFFRGTPIDEPMELRRAKIYSCDYYFHPEDAEYWPEGAETQVVENLRVHSQGGVAIAIRESDGQSFEILIREKEYPYHKVRSDFIYYSMRLSGETKSVAYGVADPKSRHFGTNAGSIGAFCHREGYTFDETF